MFWKSQEHQQNCWSTPSDRRSATIGFSVQYGQYIHSQ